MGKTKQINEKRTEKLIQRSKMVNQLESPKWKEQVQEFETLFLEFSRQNKHLNGNIYMKWLHDNNIINVRSYVPLSFSINNIARYELAQIKWDSLQTLRRKRVYAKEKELDALEEIALKQSI